MLDSRPKGYAVELYFDKKMEDDFFYFRESIYKSGVNPVLGNLGDRPHVSLAVFGEVDIEQVIKITSNFVPQCRQFPAQLSSFGAFPTDSNVVYLQPVPTHPLLDLHKRFHDHLQENDIQSSHYYLPGQWVPHCTLEFELPDGQFDLALHLCKEHFKPIQGTYSSIGVIAFRPIAYLTEYPLSK